MKLHLTWLVLAAAMLPAASHARSAKPEPAKTASTQEPDPFVGNAMCLRCHQDVQQALTANPHGSGAAPDVADNGCQSCHGPGRTHVQSPNNTNTQPSVDRMTAEQQNQLCTGCHTELPAFSTAHQVAKISCSGCHVLHERTADMGVLHLGDAAALARFASADGPLHTDDRPVIEFTAPASLGRDHSAQIAAEMRTAAAP